MKTRYLPILLCLLVLMSSCKKENKSIEVEQKNHPNILLIIADDLGLDACPNYPVGNTKANMPHLQMMMNNGITFDNFWAYPVCSPTRASILTGKYGIKTGVLNATNASTINADEQTIQSYLDKKLGKIYNHSIIGKWHLSNGEPTRPTEMGIDYYAGLLSGGAKTYNNWDLVENGVSNTSTEYITKKITDLAIDWINKQDKNWFCWLAYTAPHTPFHLPPTDMHRQGNLSTDQASIDANPLPYYMAMVESMDYEIGRLLDNIPSDELENTTIIFIGDNGTSGKVIQSPFVSNRSKGSIYQGGIATPLVVSGKGVTRSGERDGNLIGSVDLFATIANIAGIDVTTYENSISFDKLLANNTKTERHYNYSEILNSTEVKSGYTIRDEQYKLIVLDNGVKRFYDLSNDPFETNNLINKLSTEEQSSYDELLVEANKIRQ